LAINRETISCLVLTYEISPPGEFRWCRTRSETGLQLRSLRSSPVTSELPVIREQSRILLLSAFGLVPVLPTSRYQSSRVLEANSPESMSVIQIFQQQSVFCIELLDADSMVGLPSRPNNADETLLRWTRSYSDSQISIIEQFYQFHSAQSPASAQEHTPVLVPSDCTKMQVSSRLTTNSSSERYESVRGVSVRLNVPAVAPF
jgi:hypothetical protein